MPKNSIMLDIDTLSTASDAAILSIGAVKFDPLGNDNFDEFYAKIDIDSCVRLGLRISDSTINWWAQQSHELQDDVFNPDDRIDIVDAFNKFYKFCFGCQTVWSNGVSFDVVICETVFNRMNKRVPWDYWNVRDFRTLLSFLNIAPNKPEITHCNSLNTAIYQAKCVQDVMKSFAQSKNLNNI